jgi:hypothetical protein
MYISICKQLTEKRGICGRNLQAKAHIPHLGHYLPDLDYLDIEGFIYVYGKALRLHGLFEGL